MLGPLFALTLLAIAIHAFGARIASVGATPADRACTTALLVPTAVIVLVRVLGATHALTAPLVWLGTIAIVVAAFIGAGAVARRVARDDFARLGVTIRAALLGTQGLAVLLGVFATAAAAWAAYLLRPWSWDGLGYHLPVVYDALQEHRLRVIPTSVIFVNAYPHGAEWFFIAWRAWLPDDTWMDFAQLPFGVAAVVAIASTATRGGASPGRALAVGMLFLAVPVVMLQLASDYVDIAYASIVLLAAYFVTSDLANSAVTLSGLAIGLLLAIKPSAPPAAVLLAAVLLFRARLRKVPIRVVLVAIAVMALGCEPYLANLWHHHNPVWPVEVHIGPWKLPGRAAASDYINAGVPEPYLHQGFVRRVLGSWFSRPTRWVYDMRIGGFGPLFAWVLIPLVLLIVAGRRARTVHLPVAIAAIATMLSPGAFMARYTLALPGALLACAAAGTESLGRWQKRAVHLTLVLSAAIGLIPAIPALTDGGPSLVAVQRMPPAERVPVASIDERSLEWQRTLAMLAPGEAVAFDDSFELSGLLWRADGATRVVYLDHAVANATALRAWLDSARARVAVLSDEGAGAIARGDPEQFEPLFRCRFEPCVAYGVRARQVAPRRLLVVAPHPDDEVLIAAGVIHAALERGDAVHVVIVTNGDYTCERNGYVREDESVAALARLGLPEDHVHVLGYPDGHLQHLGTTPLTVERRDAHGACEHAHTTYGSRGEGRADEHTAHAGVAADYTSDALEGDLAAVIRRVAPTDVYVTHPMDEHPDHALTYAYLRRALERVGTPLVTVHRAIVHAGACWPDGSGRHEPCPVVEASPTTPMPPLPDPLSRYLPTERIVLAADMLTGAPGESLKFAAIATYRSQTGPDPAHDWLRSFDRADEVFYPERLVPDAIARGALQRSPAVVRGAGSVGPRGPWTDTIGRWSMQGDWMSAASVGSAGYAERSLPLSQVVPMRCSLVVRGAEAGTQWGFGVLAASDAGSSADWLTVRDGTRATLANANTAEPPVGSRSIGLADEGTRAAAHRYDLRLDPRPDEGGVVEVTVRRDGALIAVWVEPGGRLRGDRVRVTANGPIAFSEVGCAPER